MKNYKDWYKLDGRWVYYRTNDDENDLHILDYCNEWVYKVYQSTLEELRKTNRGLSLAHEYVDRIEELSEEEINHIIAGRKMLAELVK